MMTLNFLLEFLQSYDWDLNMFKSSSLKKLGCDKLGSSGCHGFHLITVLRYVRNLKTHSVFILL